MTVTAHMKKHSALETTLHVAFELGNSQWKLGFTTGLGQRPRVRTIAARDRKAVLDEMAAAKQRFGLAVDAHVVSCYEAGRDGFWLHRFLVAHGIENVVVDSSSIEVNRRARRAKTDRLDVGKLLAMLLRYRSGERRLWSVLHVPSVAEEDERQLHRELTTAKRERVRLVNRMRGLLIAHGVEMDLRGDVVGTLESVELWDGSLLPAGIRARLVRDWEQLQLQVLRIRELEAQRRERLRNSSDPVVDKVRQLMALRGIGPNSAWLFVMEFFGWRQFRNRKELGALAGLTPTPFRSGQSAREMGIGKAGNRHVRSVAVEIAWMWLRFQPQSRLSLWYEERFAHGGARLRKIGIVALARKLLIELWKYVEHGTLPEGAQLTPRT